MKLLDKAGLFCAGVSFSAAAYLLVFDHQATCWKMATWVFMMVTDVAMAALFARRQ